MWRQWLVRARSCQRQCRKRSIIFRRNPAWEILHNGVCISRVRTPVSEGDLQSPKPPGRLIAPQRPTEAPGSRQGREQSRRSPQAASARFAPEGAFSTEGPLRALGSRSGLAVAFGWPEAPLRLPRQRQAAQAAQVAQSTPRLHLASPRNACQALASSVSKSSRLVRSPESLRHGLPKWAPICSVSTREG